MSKKIAQLDKGGMKRVLGVADLFGVGLGDLGSSIYYALGITAFYALGATPIALLLAGVVFACTSLTYAEMSSVLQDAGGSASFSRKAFNDLISFIAGWGLLLDYIVTISISSYSVGPYLSIFFPIFNQTTAKVIFSIAIILGMILLNIKGGKHSAKFSLWLTSLAVVTQVLIIGIGVVTLVNFPELFSHMKIGGKNLLWSPSWGQFWHGVAMAMVAYTGIESMSQLSSEARNPGKTVPRAILLAMGMLLFLYLGISITALSAVTPQQLSTTYMEDPIAGIVSALPIGSAFLGPWVGFLAAFILVSAANAGLIGASRLSFNMGEFYQLPKFFYNLHKRFRTPYIALTFFGIAAALIIIWSGGRLTFLADLYNFGAMLAFFSAHTSLLLHRIRFPDVERPFKVPFNIPIGKGRSLPVTAIIGAFATAAVWVLVVVSKPDGRYLGLAWLGIGLLMYFFHRRQYEISPVGRVEIEKVKIEDYKDLSIKKILVPTRGHLATETIIIAVNIAKMLGAELTIVHVVEVSFLMPLNTNLLAGATYSEAVLNRASAIATESGVKHKTLTIRSRSVVKAVLDMVEKEHFDLVLVGTKSKTAVGPVTEEIVKKAKCKVWICRSFDESGKGESPSDKVYQKSEGSEEEI